MINIKEKDKEKLKIEEKSKEISQIPLDNKDSKRENYKKYRR